MRRRYGEEVDVDSLPEPVPTQKKKRTDKISTAASEAAFKCIAPLRKLKRWKAVLSSPLPELPPEVKAGCVVSPPPLHELCPRDFELSSWGSFMDETKAWFDEHKDGRRPCQPDLAGMFGMILWSLLKMTGELPRDVPLAYGPGLFCFPDVGRGYEGFVGFMTLRFDQEAGKSCSLESLVARLYTYMLHTDTYFGFISSYETTFACKRTMVGGASCISVSPPLLYNSGDVLKGLGYVLSLTKRGPRDLSLQATWLGAFGPRPFDRKPILRRLLKLATKVNVEDVNKLMQGMVWREDLRELQGCDCLSGDRVGTVLYSSNYQGRDVRIKVRDLSCSLGVDTDTSLRKFLREVDVHMRLRELEGDFIPELVEYGLIRGAMVCFIMSVEHARYQRPEALARKRLKISEADDGTRQVEIKGAHEHVKEASKLITGKLGSPATEERIEKAGGGDGETLLIGYPREKAEKLLGELGEGLATCLAEVKVCTFGLRQDMHVDGPYKVSKAVHGSVIKSHISKIHARGVHFGGKPKWIMSGRDRSSPCTFVGLSHASIDNSKRGMEKDLKTANKIITTDSDYVSSSDSSSESESDWTENTNSSNL